MEATHNICPYTLKRLAELSKTNVEHIFADAIGGTADYTVRVDADTNFRLGTTVDAAFVESPLLAMFRCRHGIKSRSGPSKWRLRGKTEETNRPVEVTFASDGSVDIRYLKPVEFDSSGTKGTIIIPPEQRETFLADLVANLKRKGKTLVINSEVKGQAEPVKLDFSVELNALKQGLLKIAFLATYEFLGDAFLRDSLIPEWHKAVLSASTADAMTAQIHGRALEWDEHFNILLPDLQKHEHAVAVFALQQQGPLVLVKLFGCDLLSAFCMASNTSTFGLDTLEGKITICDTKTRRTRAIPFADHFVSRSENLGDTL